MCWTTTAAKIQVRCKCNEQEGKIQKISSNEGLFGATAQCVLQCFTKAGTKSISRNPKHKENSISRVFHYSVCKQYMKSMSSRPDQF